MVGGSFKLIYTRKFGKLNKEIAALGIGCWAIGGPFQNEQGNYLAYGDVDDKESIETLRTAIDLGINLIDTADVYGCGHSEWIIGKAIKDYDREQLIIATKFGSTFDEHTKKTSGKNFTKEYIDEALNSSLNRLNTDYIDIYQIHDSRHDPNDICRIQEILENCVKEGKIRYYGWSTDDPARVSEFVKGKHCISIQYILHLTRNNKRMAEICQKNELAGIIRQPLQSGLFTGKYQTNTKRSEKHFYGKSDFSNVYYQKIFQALDEMNELISQYELSLIEAVLGYIWAKDPRTFPIPGAKTKQQILENASCLKKGPISNKLLHEIENIFQEIRTDFSYENFPYYKTDSKS